MMRSIKAFVLICAVSMAIVESKYASNDTQIPDGQRVIPSFFMNNRQVNWDDALYQCANLNLKLVTLTTSTEARYLETWFRQQEDYALDYWIGGMYENNAACDRSPSVENCYIWVDNNFNQIGPIQLASIGFGFLGDIKEADQTTKVTLAIDHNGNLHIGHGRHSEIKKFICQA